MTELHIDTGVKQYSINGFPVSFNPCDPAFVKRLFTVFSKLEADDKAWRQRLASIEDAQECMKEYDAGDAMFRKAIDEALGSGLSDAVCGETSILAFSEGAPLWALILLTVIDLLDAGIVQAQKAENPKMKKYLEKYAK